MKCLKCNRELEPMEKVVFQKLWQDIPECLCEPCWRELIKDQPVNPAYTTPKEDE